MCSLLFVSRFILISGSRRARNLVCTPYLDFGGNLFCQNRSINPLKPIRSHFHSNKIAPRLHVWEIFQTKVLHHWSVNAHLKDWKWKETVLKNTQFSLWCQKKSSDRWKLVTIFFFHLDRVIATMQAEPFLAVHMLCTEKRLCTNRVKFLFSMLSALLRYSFEPRRLALHVKCKQRSKRVVAKRTWRFCILPLVCKLQLKLNKKSKVKNEKDSGCPCCGLNAWIFVVLEVSTTHCGVTMALSRSSQKKCRPS